MKTIPALLITLLSVFACPSCVQKQEKISPDEAKQIAEEAYIFAYPMIEHYKMMFAMAMYEGSGAYAAPFSVMVNNAHLSGPQDTIIVRPNNDTFYSGVWFDLSDQPQILEVPEITDGRYYSFQIIDMFTHNIDYVGTRKTGFEKGAYLFAGPGWNGEVPDGISKLIRSEGNFLLALGRTQVYGPGDVKNAQELMSSYRVRSLDAYNGLDVSATVIHTPDLPPFDPVRVQNENFIGYLNALMGEVDLHPSEEGMFNRFSKIGIAPGRTFNPEAVDEDILSAIREGIASAREKIAEESTRLGERKNGWQLIAGAFGTREAMKDRYLTRAAAAYFGLWGNDLEEAFYPETTYDADNESLDGSTYNYILHFSKEVLPPVNAFWSLTMYKLPEQLLVENEIDRYKIGSDTEGMKYNTDGSLDIYIQRENPGNGLESNWLPAHNGKFSLQARMYWPKKEALDPLYAPPPVEKRN
ncbi:MAG: DUF1254 domain-containing protein [Bacteroidales bacterium]